MNVSKFDEKSSFLIPFSVVGAIEFALFFVSFNALAFFSYLVVFWCTVLFFKIGFRRIFRTFRIAFFDLFSTDSEGDIALGVALIVSFVLQIVGVFLSFVSKDGGAVCLLFSSFLPTMIFVVWIVYLLARAFLCGRRSFFRFFQNIRRKMKSHPIRSKLTLLFLVALALLLLLAWFFRYEYVNDSGYGVYRINRWTGKTEILIRGHTFPVE